MYCVITKASNKEIMERLIQMVIKHEKSIKIFLFVADEFRIYKARSVMVHNSKVKEGRARDIVEKDKRKEKLSFFEKCVTE